MSARDGGSGGRGRHRLGAAGRAAQPQDDTRDTDVLPVIAGLFPDAPATGLAKFDLGSIPASVTPPRTWRRAAYFAVAASILVLVGLSYAAVSLVTAPRKPEVVDALPGLPSGPNGPLELPGEAVMSPRPTAPVRSSTPSSTAPSRKPADTQPLTRPVTGHPTSASAAPVRPTTTTTVSPTRTTVETPVLIGPVADAEAIGDRTETYFAKVVADPDAAYAMTTGEARRDGQEEIERRYGQVTRIEVQRITIDSNRSRTTSTLKVVREDGSVSTEERVLTFTYGDDPKITSDTPAA